jgi:hypothetical protein
MRGNNEGEQWGMRGHHIRIYCSRMTKTTKRKKIGCQDAKTHKNHGFTKKKLLGKMEGYK